MKNPRRKREADSPCLSGPIVQRTHEVSFTGKQTRITIVKRPSKGACRWQFDGSRAGCTASEKMQNNACQSAGARFFLRTHCVCGLETRGREAAKTQWNPILRVPLFLGGRRVWLRQAEQGSNNQLSERSKLKPKQN